MKTKQLTGKRSLMLSAGAAIGSLVIPQIAMAQLGRVTQAASAPFQAAPVVSVGIGVSDFTEGNARSFTDTGMAWDVRALWGSNSRFGIEAAYVGTTNEVNGRRGQTSTLTAQGVEASGRLNFMNTDGVTTVGGLQPFVLAGVAWKNYHLSDSLPDTAISRGDDAVEVPVAAGVSFYMANNLVVDARAAYRFSFQDDLIQESGNSNLDNWNVSGRLGWAF